MHIRMTQNDVAWSHANFVGIGKVFKFGNRLHVDHSHQCPNKVFLGSNSIRKFELSALLS
jgi:hypothetical protein